jgi:hypothetical protein
MKIQSMLNADDDGDQRNYYELAHSIGEKITEQPRMLSGGQLKPYQACWPATAIDTEQCSVLGVD